MKPSASPTLLAMRTLGFIAGITALAAHSTARSTEPVAVPPHIECRSINDTMQHCRTPWRAVVLIRQISRADCVHDKTWGMDSQTRQVWVWKGCSAQFAELREDTRASHGDVTAQSGSDIEAVDEPTVRASSQGTTDTASP